jgi:E3 ubiquitin-protein ligase MYCBP2
MLVLVDRKQMKAVAEFRRAAQSAGHSCRFCSAALVPGDDMEASAVGIEACCTAPDCLALARLACVKKHACGHACCGLRGESACMPCLRGCVPRSTSKLTQDADDECMICFSGALPEEPCVQVGVCCWFFLI